MGDTREGEQHLSTRGALQPLGLYDDDYHEYDYDLVDDDDADMMSMTMVVMIIMRMWTRITMIMMTNEENNDYDDKRG